MFEMELWIRVIVRAACALVVGGIIGSERARHGQAAGIRTHILVCLGASMTSMTSMYVHEICGYEGDVFRIPAQVVSGISFLGAGMIILKNNNVIRGLTTAAGIWVTSTLGVAIGYGFYTGAIVGAAVCLGTTAILSKVGKRKDSAEILYIEIDNVYETNRIARELEEIIQEPFTYQVIEAKSGCTGHLGMFVTIEKRTMLSMEKLCNLKNVVLAVED